MKYDQRTKDALIEHLKTGAAVEMYSRDGWLPLMNTDPLEWAVAGKTLRLKRDTMTENESLPDCRNCAKLSTCNSPWNPIICTDGDEFVKAEPIQLYRAMKEQGK